MSTHTRVRTDNMSGTTLGQDLVTLKYATGAIDNGTIMKIGAIATGEREVRAASIPAVGDPLSSLALIASPEVCKDKKLFTLGDFTNEANSLMRGYRLNGGIFSVTEGAFADEQTLEVGKIVELNGLGKMITVTTGTANSTKIGTIIAIEGDYYVIEVA